VTLNPVNAAAYALSGDVTETNVGSYNATVTLNNGYEWDSAPATEVLALPWSIVASPITTVAITVADPIKNTPITTTATGDNNTAYSVSPVTWDPSTDTEFAVNETYKATVTLTAEAGYTFAGFNATGTATINTKTATVVTSSASAITISYTFDPVPAATINAITILAAPTKMAYDEGDQLALAGLRLKIEHDDPSADVGMEDVAYGSFPSAINIAPPNGTILATTNTTITITGGSAPSVSLDTLKVRAKISTVAINVTAPKAGATPDNVATGTGDYSASSVTWTPPTTTTFGINTPYTASVTLTANTGFTFAGLANATINGGATTTITNNTGATVTLSYQFPATGLYEITSASVTVPEPATGQVPGTTLPGTNFTGAITWSPIHNPFQGGVAYTAAVTLTPDTDYEFAMPFIAANLTHNCSTVNTVNSTGAALTFDCVFPATTAANVTAIAVKTQPSKLAYEDGEQLDLTGLVATLTYDLLPDEDVPFASFTGKLITTSPADGFTLTNANHDGTRVLLIYNNSSTLRDSTNALTVNPPPAGQITTAAIVLTAPQTGSAPVTTITSSTGTNFTVVGTTNAVTWDPNPTTFAGGEQYTASVTLQADPTYEFAPAFAASINGDQTETTMDFNTDRTEVTLSRTFTTSTATLSTIAVNAGTMKTTYIHGDTLDLTGLAITLTLTDNSTITDTTGYGLVVTHTAPTPLAYTTGAPQSITITVTRPGTPPITGGPAGMTITVNKAPITIAEVTVTAPVTGSAPNTTATVAANANFTAGAVTWTPTVPSFLPLTQYTATVTLTAATGYEFVNPLTTATINSFDATPTNNGTTLTLAYQFPETTREINTIEIAAQPQTTYTSGDPLDLTDLKVRIVYVGGTDSTVAFSAATTSDFAQLFTTSLAHGSLLTVAADNTRVITVTLVGSNPAKTASTTALTVTPFQIDAPQITIEGNPVAGEAASTVQIGPTQGTTQPFNVSSIVWDPAVATTFAPGQTYTATVILTPTPTEAEFPAGAMPVITGGNGSATGNPTATVQLDGSLKLDYKFAATKAERKVIGIEVATQPPLTHTHEASANISSLVVTLKYNEDIYPDEDFTCAQILTNNNLSMNFGGTSVTNCNVQMNYAVHNGDAIVITYDNGADAPINVSTGTFTVNPSPITTAGITVTAPKAGESPSTAVTVSPSGKFIVEPDRVTWDPKDDPFENKEYTVTVELQANSGFTFEGLTTATINGSAAVIKTPGGDNVTLEYTFKLIRDFEVTKAPAKLAYEHGNLLDISDMEIEITYDDNSKEIVKQSAFKAKGVVTTPEHGIALAESQDGTAIMVEFNGISKPAGTLIITKASITAVAIRVTPPQAGDQPDRRATPEGTAPFPFTLDNVSWDPSDITFENNRQYAARVTVRVEPGNTFAENITATINGKNADIISNTGTTIIISYKFPFLITGETIVVTVGDAVLTPENRNFSYTVPCKTERETITVPQQGNMDVTIDNAATNSVSKRLSNGENKVPITITKDGILQDYMLTINKPIEAMIKVRWGNTLTVVTNTRYTPYDFASYKWYRNGREVGIGQSWSAGAGGEKIHPEDKFFVEAKTENDETIISCEEKFAVQAPEYGILLKGNNSGKVKFQIATPEKAEMQISIFDVSGNVVQKLNGSSNHGFAANIPNGLYIITAKAIGESGAVYRYSTKLVVKK
jgi:hypothetical protein